MRKKGAECPRLFPTAGRFVTFTEECPRCASTLLGPVLLGARAAGRERPSLVLGVLGPCCRVFLGRSPWASFRALRGQCSRAHRCPQPVALASCVADESAAGSLPLVSVSLSTPLTAAEMAPYMKRLSRGQSVEGESGSRGPTGPGLLDTQNSRCLLGHFLTVGAEKGAGGRGRGRPACWGAGSRQGTGVGTSAVSGIPVAGGLAVDWHMAGVVAGKPRAWVARQHWAAGHP